MAEFERSVRAWSRGSSYVNITDEQYAKPKQGRVTKSAYSTAAVTVEVISTKPCEEG